MLGKIKLTALSFTVLFAVAGAINAYGEENSVTHYQGKDCMTCHKNGEHQILLAGTVFFAYNSATPCSGASLQFMDPTNSAVIYDTTNYYSKGVNGIGNFYIRKTSVPTGSYFMRIISADGLTLAQSGAPHTFSGNKTTTDLNNRYSCNACHAAVPSNGAAGPIYVQKNVNKCSNYTQTGNTCAATLSANLKLHVPILTYNGQTYAVDFQYSPESDFTLTSVSALSDPSTFSSCVPSTLTYDFMLHIPVIMYNEVSYKVDLTYVPATDNSVRFKLTGATVN